MGKVEVNTATVVELAGPEREFTSGVARHPSCGHRGACLVDGDEGREKGGGDSLLVVMLVDLDQGVGYWSQYPPVTQLSRVSGKYRDRTA